MSNFNELLKIGNLHEDEAINRIQKMKNVKLTMRQGAENFKVIHYDFLTNDNIKYEVKADLLSNKTGNLFIEFVDGRGKISGLALSTADYYIFYTNDIYILICIEKLKQLTINKPIRRAKDGTKGYIIKWELIRDAGEII